jgi:hypothetical protein
LVLLFPVVLLLGLAFAWRIAARAPGGERSGLALAPDVLDFGRVAIGSSETRPFIVTNFGSGRLTLTRLEVGEPFELPWGSRSFDGPLPLEPGESQAISIVVRPSERGPVDALLRVESEEAGLALPLRAVGYRPPEIDVSPPSLSFGEVGVGSLSAGLVTIRNEGDAELRVEIEDELPFRAGISEAIVPAGGEIEVPIAFAPDRAGRHEAWLQVRSNDSRQGELMVHLRGAGRLSAPEPRIETSAGTVDFGVASACETRERSLRITNRGPDALSIASATAAPPFAAANESRRLESGRSFELALAFAPTQAGAERGRLLIHSNDPRSGVVAVELRGEAASACASGPANRAQAALGARASPRLAALSESPGGAPPSESAAGEPDLEPRAPEPQDPEAEQPRRAASPPPVRAGSRIRLGSNSSEITPAHLSAVRLDPASGELRLEGLRLPTVEFPFGETFEFEPTGALGRVTQLGEAELRIPLEIVDRYGEQMRLEVPLTTGTARTRSEGTLFTRAGEPLGTNGDATLVGLATFPSGRLEGFKLEIVLNVHVAP